MTENGPNRESSALASVSHGSAPLAERHVPCIAFFGTKGGVGKTTIMEKFGSLVVRSDSGPNVLLVDFDVHHRGLTVLRTREVTSTCPSIHEYIADPSLPFRGAHDVTPVGDPMIKGRELLIPSSDVASTRVFQAVAQISPQDLLGRIRGLLAAAIAKYKIDIVLIDCGPIVDPLTASAAYQADMAFIIGQNEPISFQSLLSYVRRIQDFFPDFKASNVRIILNKVRGNVKNPGAYAAIPFTMEVVDYSEGIPGIDEVRMSLLDHHIRELINDLLHAKYPHLVPSSMAVLWPKLRESLDGLKQWTRSKLYRRLWAGTIGYVASAVLLLAAAVALLTTTFPEPTVETPHPVRPDWALWASVGAVALGLLAVDAARRSWNRLRTLNKLRDLHRTVGASAMADLLKTSVGRQQLSQIVDTAARIKEEGET